MERLTRTVENEVEVPAAAPAVWDRVVHPEGINHEMRPWMTMSMPRGASGLTVDTVPLGQPIGRAWLRLFGLIPFDVDHLTIAEVDPGRRFLERSTMLSMRRWEHERTLTPCAAGTRVHDRVTLQPRLPIPGLAALLARVVDVFFKHRQRRLLAHFAAEGTARGSDVVAPATDSRRPRSAHMTRIVVFGGTGYTGGNVLREAVARGHEVVSVSRSQPKDRIDGVTYEVGPAEQIAARVATGADAVVAALAPRGDMAGRLVEVYSELAQAAADAGARYLQVGGFSSLRPAPDLPRFVEGQLGEAYRAEALEGEATRIMLAERAPQNLDWVFISPAGSYGAWAAGRRTGTYRVGGEVALFDEAGASVISGADFASAIVDEIETPTHHRTHIGVAY